MDRSLRNYWLDVVLGLLAVVVGLSAFLLWVVLPQGYFAARLLWLDIHKWSGLLLSVGVLLHVILHWKWLLRMTRLIVSRPSERRRSPARWSRDGPDGV
ncbi:MAG: DUF4405 domain-containing protein [Chloroflexota bacterium]